MAATKKPVHSKSLLNVTKKFTHYVAGKKEVLLCNVTKCPCCDREIEQGETTSIPLADLKNLQGLGLTQLETYLPEALTADNGGVEEVIGCDECNGEAPTPPQPAPVAPKKKKGAKSKSTAEKAPVTAPVAPEKPLPVVVDITWGKDDFLVTLKDKTAFTVRKVEHLVGDILVLNGERYADSRSKEDKVAFAKLENEHAAAIEAKRQADLAKYALPTTPKPGVLPEATDGEAAPAKGKKDKAEKKEPAAKDRFGCRVDSQAGQINKCVPEAGSFTLESVIKCTGLDKGRIKGHMKSLVAKGFVVVDGEGFAIKGSEKKAGKKSKAK